MRPEVLTYASLQDCYLPFRVQATAVHDAYAPMLTVTAAFDESSGVCARFGSCHAVQVAPVSGGVISPLQLPDFPPVNAVRGEAFV